MNRVYFTVRSVTPGQKGSAALRRGGIDHRLVRAPRVIAPEGCAYALMVREAELGKAAGLLEREGVAAFPDAPTERGAKHLRELTEWAKSGNRAAVFFLIQMCVIEAGASLFETPPHPSSALRGTADATFPSRGRLFTGSLR